jgi:hypothetical protein
MQGTPAEPGIDQEPDVLGPGMPGWEKATWILIVIWIIIVFTVYWYLGWRNLGFPL